MQSRPGGRGGRGGGHSGHLPSDNPVVWLNHRLAVAMNDAGSLIGLFEAHGERMDEIHLGSLWNKLGKLQRAAPMAWA